MNSETFQRVMDGYADTPQERVLLKMRDTNVDMFMQMWQAAWESEQNRAIDDLPLEADVQEITHDEAELPVFNPRYMRWSAIGELEYFCKGHDDWHAATEFRNDYSPGKRGGHASCAAFYKRGRGHGPAAAAETSPDQPSPDQPPTVIKCNKCGKEKPVAEFWRNPNTKSGYEGTCRACRKFLKARTEESNRVGYAVSWCRHHNAWHAVSEFPKDKANKLADGLSLYCNQYFREMDATREQRGTAGTRNRTRKVTRSNRQLRF